MSALNYPLPDHPPPVTDVIATLSDGTKVKRRMVRMRACNEKDEKGKLCAGHLKRWFDFGEEIGRRFGPDAEVYRCEYCRTLYAPNPEEPPRSGTLCW